MTGDVFYGSCEDNRYAPVMWDRELGRVRLHSGAMRRIHSTYVPHSEIIYVFSNVAKCKTTLVSLSRLFSCPVIPYVTKKISFSHEVLLRDM